MERKEFYRISSNGEGQVFSRSWVCEKPWAIVQIAHGMAEYCNRYDEFAEKLVEIGVNVYANDHLGHGMSKQGHQGTFAMKKGGFDYLLEDMNTLFTYAEEKDGKLPKILLGHSMGSILAELYASKYKDIDGLVLSGTVAPNSSVNAAIGIANFHIATHGFTSVSPLLKKLTDFGKKGDSPMERFSWISSDTNVVKKYVEDEDCGFDFSASANREMFLGLKNVTSKEWAENVPMIPVFIISGSEDPVGNKGVGPKYYYDQLLNTGHDKVTLKIYENDKHEILNEVNREEVYADITNWINEKIKEQLL
ncbi:MAG: alpha/beta fold hydrolase [Peptostreptococcaceae bacterium]|nr:alpha/beta fold hydrolase [Peptostreptococcaceae bacterium]